MSNVLPLFHPRQSRTAELRQWFVQQAREPAGHVAAVSVFITGDGVLKTSGRGVDAERAEVMLAGLRSVVGRLEAMAAEEALGQHHATRQGQVIQFRRAA